MICVQDVRDTTREVIAELLAPFVSERQYFKARTIAREMLLKLYGLNHMILGFDEVVWSWTRKIALTLSELVDKGILEIYSRNSRGRLYKKIKEKEG